MASNKRFYINGILILFLMMFVLDIVYNIFKLLHFSFVDEMPAIKFYNYFIVFIFWSYPIIFIFLLFLRNYVSRYVKISYLLILIIKVCLIVIYIKNGGL